MKNRCGWKWIPIKPPYWWLHNASCEIHDENYLNGGTREDRLSADVGFLWRMIQDANELSYNTKRVAVLWACIYYFFVRCFGWISFSLIPKLKNIIK